MLVGPSTLAFLAFLLHGLGFVYLGCIRGQLQQHRQPFRNPVPGDRIAMVGDARQRGRPDLIYINKKVGWVPDPKGRAVLQSAWMVAQILS